MGEVIEFPRRPAPDRPTRLVVLRLDAGDAETLNRLIDWAEAENARAAHPGRARAVLSPGPVLATRPGLALRLAWAALLCVWVGIAVFIAVGGAS